MIKKIIAAALIVMFVITAYRLYKIEQEINKIDELLNNRKCHINKNK
jgi:hypothetical protein